MNIKSLIEQKNELIFEINENALFYLLKGVYDLCTAVQTGFIVYEASYGNSFMYKIGLANCSEEYFSDHSTKRAEKRFDKENFVILNLDSLQTIMSLASLKSIEEKLRQILPLLNFINDFNSMKEPDSSNFYSEFKSFILSKNSLKKLRVIDSGVRVILVSSENFNLDFKNLFSSQEQFIRFEKFMVKTSIPDLSSTNHLPGRGLKI